MPSPVIMPRMITSMISIPRTLFADRKRSATARDSQPPYTIT